MTSFVEQATLQVTDKSTKEVRKITKELAKLEKQAKRLKKIDLKMLDADKAARQVNKVGDALRRLPRSKSVRVNVTMGKGGNIEAQLKRLDKFKEIRVGISIPGLTQSVAKLKEMNTQLAAIARRKNLNVNVNANTNTNTGLGPRRGAGGFGGAAAGGALGALSTTPFPGNLPAAFNIATAYMTVRTLERAGRTAVEETLRAQSLETRLESIVRNDAQRAVLMDVGRNAATGADQTSITRGREIALDLYVTGFRDEVLAGLAPHIASLEAAAVAVNPARAAQITTLSNKLGSLAAVTEDLERAQELTTAVYRAAVIQGETFNAPSTISALRIAGIAQTISDEGLLRFGAAVDDLQRPIGSGTARLVKLLTSPLGTAGVSQGQVNQLIAAGLRTEQGLSPEQHERLGRDPLGYIEKEIGGRLRAMGLDTRSTEDRAEVKRALIEMGFVTAELRIITNELAAGNERDKAIELALDPDATVGAAADDLGYQLRNLAQQFRSFSSETLDPIFSALAPAARSVADYLKELSGEEGAAGQLKRFGVIVGSVTAALVALRGASALTGFLTGMNGSAAALNGSAAQLTAAARALQGAAAAGGGVGGVGAGGKGGTPGAAGRSVAGSLVRGLPMVVGASFVGNEIGRSYNRSQMSEEQQVAEAVNHFTAVAEKRDRLNQRFEELLGPKLTSMINQPFGGAFGTREERQARRDASTAQNLFEVMARNVRRIDEPGRSPESVTSLINQQFANAEKLRGLGADGADINQFLTGAALLPTELETALATGAEELVPVLGQAATDFGPEAAQGLLALAPQIGQAIAEGARARLENIALDVNSRGSNDNAGQAPRLDTGGSFPQ